MKKAKFIINPVIDENNLLNRIESIAGCLIMNQIVNHIDVVYTHKENDAMTEAMKMQPGEYDFVVCAGGDGTLHDIVNGVIRGGSCTPIAVYKAGTANSFAGALELPSDKVQFCRMIKRFKTLKVDVGKIDDSYFINEASAGMITDAVYKTPRENKIVLGKAAYMLEGVKLLPKQVLKSTCLEFKTDNFYKKADVSMFVVKNSGNATGNKDADVRKIMTDGLLDVLIVEKMNVFTLPKLFLKFMQGEHLNEEGITYFQTQTLDINNVGTQNLTIDLDKEKYGKLPVHIESVKEAIQIIVP
ncbi:MAG TPA: diacylglycerol kinase family lipid kinase [Candidatus Scybalocola faecipullorum]|nr:diacylglycerol kinase family lipid kinase [Candidatus Scybalocola faecipullorum]